MSHPAVFTLNV